MEEWTAKYVSATLIKSHIKSVLKWAEDYKPDDGYPGLKVSSHGTAVIAKFPLGLIDADEDTPHMEDERVLAIQVTIPDCFPLKQAEVLSYDRTNRFEERRWKNWLLAAQGVIALSANSRVEDGLLAWRRNVLGALQGRSECNICYSLVGEDGKRLRLL